MAKFTLRARSLSIATLERASSTTLDVAVLRVKSFEYIIAIMPDSHLDKCAFSVGEASGKPLRAVANRIPGPNANTEAVRERVSTATGEVGCTSHF